MKTIMHPFGAYFWVSMPFRSFIYMCYSSKLKLMCGMTNILSGA
uniref:Uncharacterized protein n=1 Tax=Tetranychus urticae TaxID=32264 RepID=T1KLT8_TETUR